MGIVLFDSMADAERGVDALEAAGYELNIRHDLVDLYSSTVFMEAWRYVAPNTDEGAATSAVLDELNDIVDPFRGLADDVGVYSENEAHDFYGSGDGTKPPSFAQTH
jgi:hypothetical protein